MYLRLVGICESFQTPTQFITTHFYNKKLRISSAVGKNSEYELGDDAVKSNFVFD